MNTGRAHRILIKAFYKEEDLFFSEINYLRLIGEKIPILAVIIGR